MTTAAVPPRRFAGTLLVPLLAAVLVGGAAPAGAQQASPTPAPTPSPTSSALPDVMVTQADSGRTVRLVPGQHLAVELTAPQGEQWHGPATAGPLYLVDYTEGAERTTARLQALRADADGEVLQARTDRECFHNGQPCPQAFMEWRLTVVIDPGPPASGAYPCSTMPAVQLAPGHVLLTEQDSGRRVTVEQGRSVLVQLRGCSDPYTVPDSGGPLFRESATYRANGVNSTTFQALSLGTTSILAQTDPACFHVATPCARPSMRWSVEVEVVPQMADDSCMVPTAVELDRPRIVATGTARATVRSASGVTVDLYAYTRPSTTFRLVRTATTGTDGLAVFELRPPANTRLYAQKRGCAPGPQVVLEVATALTLGVERVGARTYRFSGDSLPARPGGLVVSLYRVGSDGREVLTAQARADAASGEWQLVRTFTGTGRFGFVARTGADVQNAAGRSTMRTALVF
jgi:hypothetical protein